MNITLNNILDPAAAGATNRSAHSVLARVVAGGTLLAALVLMPSAVKAQADPSGAATNWTAYGSPIKYSMSELGPTAFGHDNSGQHLKTQFEMQVYKSAPTNDGLDWYLVAGPYYQGVTDANSKGWIAVAMDLNIMGLTGPGLRQNVPARLYDAQPATTTLTDHSTVDIGASLGFSSSGVVPGIGRTYSVTVDAPAVVVGTTNAGNTANFHFSYSTSSSEQLQYAAIFNVQHGQGLFLQMTPDAWWNYYGTSSTQITNIYAQGALVADFGAAPSGNEPAIGAEIVNQATGLCMTTSMPERGGNSPVSLATCDPANNYQHWYYSAGLVVNTFTGTCLDISGGTGQGDTASSGTPLVTNACDFTHSSQSSWQLTTTMSSNGAINLRGLNGFIATPASNGTLVLGASGSSSANTVFYVQ